MGEISKIKLAAGLATGLAVAYNSSSAWAEDHRVSDVDVASVLSVPEHIIDRTVEGPPDFSKGLKVFDLRPEKGVYLSDHVVARTEVNSFSHIVDSARRSVDNGDQVFDRLVVDQGINGEETDKLNSVCLYEMRISSEGAFSVDRQLWCESYHAGQYGAWNSVALEKMRLEEREKLESVQRFNSDMVAGAGTVNMTQSSDGLNLHYCTQYSEDYQVCQVKEIDVKGRSLSSRVDEYVAGQVVSMSSDIVLQGADVEQQAHLFDYAAQNLDKHFTGRPDDFVLSWDGSGYKDGTRAISKPVLTPEGV